jgi:hypothetical protein
LALDCSGELGFTIPAHTLTSCTKAGGQAFWGSLLKDGIPIAKDRGAFAAAALDAEALASSRYEVWLFGPRACDYCPGAA